MSAGIGTRQSITVGDSLRLPSNGRFRNVKWVGQGATGIVYEVYDTQAEQSVAAKTIARIEATQLYNLKREFRTLSDLRHPNLVRLYELHADADQCFFTMELLAAQDFVTSLRGRARFAPTVMQDHPGRVLRDALRQLTVGLDFLHQRGVVHRDIKPANVLVERTGRVVLLDFGLAEHLDQTNGQRGRAASLAGTPAYMAPETILGAEYLAAADFFSVGVMLFNALTGASPFGESYLVDVLSGVELTPPDPGELAVSVPEDLLELTLGLLSPAPNSRPTAEDILTVCRRDTNARTPIVESNRRAHHFPFVGREPELRELRLSLEESRFGMRVVEVLGPSGIGKTALIEQFLTTASSQPCITLRSICHPRETIPFKLIDGIVDDLATALSDGRSRLSLGNLSPRFAALMRIFPVMGRVAELAARDFGPLPSEPHEIRRAAIDCLRELLQQLSQAAPVILWIDDAQWGDADSLLALQQIFRSDDSPNALLIVSYRLDPDALKEGRSDDLPSALSVLDQARRQLVLQALDPEQAGTLAGAVLGRDSVDSALLVDRVAREADGMPALVVELSNALADAPDFVANTAGPELLANLLATRFGRLGHQDREALEVLALAGRPLDEPMLSSLLNRRTDHLLDMVDTRLLRLVAGNAGLAVGLYHDTVREVVVARIADERRRQIHLRIATAIKSSPGRYDDSLVDHWINAGMLENAVDSAVDLAASAQAAGAFLRAASLYRRAIELDTGRHPRWLLSAKLASSLMDAGRSSDAAPILIEAADVIRDESPIDFQHLALRRRAVAAYLRSGLHREGTAALRDAGRLLGVGYPSDRVRSLWWIASARSRLKVLDWRFKLFGEPMAREVARDDAERLELLWSAGQGLSFLDALRSTAFQANHALLARRTNDIRHRARALSADAMFLAWRHGDRRWAKTEAMLNEGERLATESGDPTVLSHSMLMRACALALNTRWSAAFQLAESGYEYCRSTCRGARWELVMFQQTMLLARTMMGQLNQVAELLDRCLHDASDSGDEFAKASLPIGIPNLAWLGRDDADEAERRIQEAIGDSFTQRSLWLLYHGEYARGHIDLYRGQGREGLRRIERLWKHLRRGGFLQTPSIRINMHDLLARCALYAAGHEAAHRGEREELIEISRAHARKMQRERTAWAAPFIDRINGVAAALGGDTAQASAFLRRAEQALARQDLGLIRAGTLMRLARLSSGEPASELRSNAAKWMTDNGVIDPERMTPLC